MVIKNGYEARLAKMAGDENVTIPKPTNAYMKYMDDIDIEGGGGGSGTGWLKVTMTLDGDPEVATLDKTAGEICAAFPFVIAVEDYEGKFTAYQLDIQIVNADEGYEFRFQHGNSHPWIFYASTANDLPTDQERDAPAPGAN